MQVLHPILELHKFAVLRPGLNRCKRRPEPVEGVLNRIFEVIVEEMNLSLQEVEHGFAIAQDQFALDFCLGRRSPHIDFQPESIF